jgi:hypothetical protein
MQGGGATRPLADFASVFLSTGSNDWNNPETSTLISSILSTSISGDQVFCSIPSMSLKQRKHHSGSSSKDMLEQDAATSLNEPMEVFPTELQNLSTTIACNILQSFMSLVDSRLRSTLQALWRHAHNDPTNRMSQILHMLFATSGNLVTPTNIVNAIRVVGASSNTTDGKTISLLEMESVIDVNILDQHLSLVLAGSGIISGIFETPSSTKLAAVAVSINTVNFLRTMMSSARETVKLATNKFTRLVMLSWAQAGGDILPPTLKSQHTSQQVKKQMSHASAKSGNTIGAYHDEKTNESSGEVFTLLPQRRTTDLGYFLQQHRSQQPYEQQIRENDVLGVGTLKRKCSGVDLLRLAANSLD